MSTPPRPARPPGDRDRDGSRPLAGLRLTDEPEVVQLGRHRRLTWMLTAIPGLLALGFVGLFTAFGRPLIGLGVAAVLLLPIVALAWLDHAILSRRVGRYESERRTLAPRGGGPPPSGPPEPPAEGRRES